jgi:hypothetical protein
MNKVFLKILYSLALKERKHPQLVSYFDSFYGACKFMQYLHDLMLVSSLMWKAHIEIRV